MMVGLVYFQRYTRVLNLEDLETGFSYPKPSGLLIESVDKVAR